MSKREQYNVDQTRHVVGLPAAIVAQAVAPDRPPLISVEFERPQKKAQWKKVFIKPHGVPDSAPSVAVDAPDVSGFEIKAVDETTLTALLQQLDNAMTHRNSLLALEGRYLRAIQETKDLLKFLEDGGLD